MNNLCMAHGCPAAGSETCSYVGHDAVGCWTVWCAQHIRLAGGGRFCRRHASTVLALRSLPLAGGGTAPMPQVANRGASLVRWMGREIDARISALIVATGADRAAADGYTELIGETQGRWTRRWTAERGPGQAVTVRLSIEEPTDDRLDVLVNDTVVYSDIPRWIARHRAGDVVDAAGDARDREEYVETVVRAIEGALR